MQRSSRRQYLTLLGTGATAVLTGCSAAPGAEDTASTAPTDQPTSAGDRPTSIGLEPVVQGLRAPVAMAFLPDMDRRYVLEQPGIVVSHDEDGVADEPALDIRDSVTAGGEKGLLGIALHPEFAENRKLYLRYSAPIRPGTPSGYSHTFVLSEFEATADASRIKRDSERTILEIPEPQANHNAGDLAFGPDGYLYVAVGDGGAANDQGNGHVDDWYEEVSGGNGQDVTENLLGSLLRIDVDSRDGDAPYGIPADNPLVDDSGLDEHYAWGLRNPWRFAFDGDDLYVADVGQNRFEEVNLVEAGGNYGWNVKEGTHCFRGDDCPDRTSDDVRGGEPLIDPIIEYPHSGAAVSGISVIGGQVYRGETLPGLEGTYVFGDLQADGTLFTAAKPDGDGHWPPQPLSIANDDAGRLGRLFSFARDDEGELYVLGVGSRGGGVHRLVPAG